MGLFFNRLGNPEQAQSNREISFPTINRYFQKGSILATLKTMRYLHILKQVHFKNGFLLFLSLLLIKPVSAQNTEAKIIMYNTLLGGISGGIGALINKKKDQKWHKVFIKGFAFGCGGGALVYSGKKMNFLVSKNQNLGYCWLSRAVFSAGNSIVENAAANRAVWSQWHYDVGFIRLEFTTKDHFKIQPRVMPSAFGGCVFMAIHGRLDPVLTLYSGTPTFHTSKITYATNLVGSTTSNGFLLVDTLITGKRFYDVYAHEMVHTFQFQEFSGVNNFFIPLSDKWKVKSQRFKRVSQWVYFDINYELMLVNYFMIQRGPKGHVYCGNYLENEAEFLSVGRSACLPD